MSEWIETFDTGNTAFYRKGDNKHYVLVRFDNRAGGCITVEEWEKRRKNICEDIFFPSNEVCFSLEDLEWITAKAKELFKE